MKSILLLATIFILSSCSNDEVRFVGKWIEKSSQDSVPSIIIHQHGDKLMASIDENDYPATYEPTRKELIVDTHRRSGCFVFENNYRMRYSVKNNELAVSETDMDSTGKLMYGSWIVYKRKIR
ncbi:hypothetical protein LRS06_06115 [Hymenobacter sp. J193]|uniref:hypothetical protein n=1 Tax=Hymenobacter sp. J193 TaxID=2898429 RepID=UPI00215088F7|nr:hypothetical protein [Hymenobacter sp. J193]MCR5887361.1 hypothetical protein [Hymenobacter sp. J193]